MSFKCSVFISAILSFHFAKAQFVSVTTETNERPVLGAPRTIFPNLKPEPPPAPCADEALQIETTQFKEVEKQTQAVVNAVEPALAIAGQCPGTNGDAAEDLARDVRRRLGSVPKIRITKDDGKAATTEDWVAVDLIARTLYAEVGGSSRCAGVDAYFKAVGRVLLNRRDYMRDPNKDRYTNFYKRGSSVKNEIALAAINPSEFHVWKDDQSAWAICPPNEVRKTYKGTDGKPTVTSGPYDYVRWFAALQAASDMVFKEKQFRCETKAVKALFYSRSSKSPGPNFKRLRGMRVDGIEMDDSKCVQLWESPVAPFSPPKPDCA